MFCVFSVSPKGWQGRPSQWSAEHLSIYDNVIRVSVFCVSVFLCFYDSVFLCFCVFSVLWKDDRDGSQRSAERLSNHFLWSIPARSTLHQYLLFSDDQRSMQYYGDNPNHPLILIITIAWKEQIIWMAIGHIIVEKLILD